MQGLKFQLDTNTEGPIYLYTITKQLVRYHQLVSDIKQEPIEFLTYKALVQVITNAIKSDELKYNYDVTTDTITSNIVVFTNYQLVISLHKDISSLPSVESRITLLETQLEELNKRFETQLSKPPTTSLQIKIIDDIKYDMRIINTDDFYIEASNVYFNEMCAYRKHKQVYHLCDLNLNNTVVKVHFDNWWWCACSGDKPICTNIHMHHSPKISQNLYRTMIGFIMHHANITYRKNIRIHVISDNSLELYISISQQLQHENANIWHPGNHYSWGVPLYI